MFQEFPEDNKSDDFLNEFRQKIADQSAANFEEKRNEMKRSKSVFIGAVSGVALAGIVGWFVLSPRYAVNNPEEIPVIRRPQTAVKVQPSEPGGMEILNQDKSVYDIIEKKSGNETIVENLLPPPEQPKLPVIQAQAEPVKTAPAAAQTEAAPVPATDKIIAEAQKITQAEEEPEAKVITIKEAARQEAATTQPREQPKAEKPAAPKPAVQAKTDEAPKAAPIKDKKETKPAAANKAIAVKEIPSGTWQVQLMSSQNKKAIENAWNSLVKKYAVLQGQPHEIETADLDFDGVFYRLKAGAFRDRAGADKLCKDIKALGGTCIVKKK